MRGASSAARRLASAAVVAAAVCVPPAHALLITPSFDTSITTNANASVIESSINSAINAIDQLYSNTITVPVDFTYDSAPLSNLLSTSQTYNSVSYAGYVSQLTADATAHPSNAILATAVGHLPANLSFWGSNGTGGLALSAPLCQMLGFIGCATNSATININSSQTFGFTQPVSGSAFDLTGGLEHELDEVLGGGGAGSTLNSVGGSCVGSPGGFFCNKIGPLDLYRYASAGTRGFSATSESNPIAYLSVDGGHTNIAWFNQNQNGDMADFAGDVADGAANQCGTLLAGGAGGQLIQNAFNCTGPYEAYTSGSPEYMMMESIGWDPVPEPGTLALLGAAVIGVVGARRGRGRG